MSPFLTPPETAASRTYYEQTMTGTVRLERSVGVPNRTNTYNYAPAEAVVARIVQVTEQVFTTGGQQTVAVTRLMLPYGTGVKDTDRLTLPDGTQPPLLRVEHEFPSNAWPLCERVFTGRA